MRTFEEIKDTVETGFGKHTCDLRIENIRLVNVFSGEIYPTSIHIRGGRIISIDPNARLDSASVLDGGGRFAVPGLIDSHMHFESTMLSPEALASVVVPQGTTTLCADLMEIANVAGEEGLRAMLRSIDRLPYRMLIEVSSRVPTAPGLETTGAVLDAEAVNRIMKWPESVSLGELDPSKILFVKDEYIQKVANALADRKIVNGHAIGRMGQDLNVYASSGISDDHECVTEAEMVERLRVGMKVLIREGSSERNADALLGAVVKHRLPTPHLMFCTDDKHAADIRREGHINYIVRRAIALGVDPMEAVEMATVNAARHFRLEDEIGSITPGRKADILLVDSLEEMKPSVVLFEGKIVAENGKLTDDCQIGEYPDWIRRTVRLKRPITGESFRMAADSASGEVNIHVIDMIPRQIINRDLQAVLPVQNGQLHADTGRDIIKIAVVERYGKNGNVGKAFIHGFGLQKGAMAYSMSHDHHNIVVVGVDDSDMALAVNKVAEMNGGLCVAADGKILDSMALPIGGLMSPEPAECVMDGQNRMNEAARRIGCVLESPFMSLSFVSLPTVPELGLTDMGLIDVAGHRLIPMVIA